MSFTLSRANSPEEGKVLVANTNALNILCWIYSSQTVEIDLNWTEACCLANA